MRNEIRTPNGADRYLDLSKNALSNLKFFSELSTYELIITVGDYYAQVQGPHFHVKANVEKEFPERILRTFVKEFSMDFAIIDNSDRQFTIASTFVKFGGIIFLSQNNRFQIVQL